MGEKINTSFVCWAKLIPLWGCIVMQGVLLYSVLKSSRTSCLQFYCPPHSSLPNCPPHLVPPLVPPTLVWCCATSCASWRNLTRLNNICSTRLCGETIHAQFHAWNRKLHDKFFFLHLKANWGGNVEGNYFWGIGTRSIWTETQTHTDTNTRRILMLKLFQPFLFWDPIWNASTKFST